MILLHSDTIIIRRQNPNAGARDFIPHEISLAELFEEFHKMSKARLIDEVVAGNEKSPHADVRTINPVYRLRAKEDEK